MKNELLKNLGIILILAGVGFLVYHFVAAPNDNWPLLTAVGAMLVGVIVYVLINKRIY